MPKPKPAPGLGSAIAAARERAGLSQQVAATRAGLSGSAWSQWERGLRVPRDGALLAIARACGVPLSALLAPPPGAATD